MFKEGWGDPYKLVLILEAANIWGNYRVPGPGLWAGTERNPTWYSPRVQGRRGEVRERQEQLCHQPCPQYPCTHVC